MIRLLLAVLLACKDPQHHAYKSGPRLGRITHWLAVILIGALLRFCPQCWSARYRRLAS